MTLEVWTLIAGWFGALATGGGAIAAAVAITLESKRRRLESIEKITCGHRRLNPESALQEARSVVFIENASDFAITVERFYVAVQCLGPQAQVLANVIWIHDERTHISAHSTFFKKSANFWVSVPQPVVREIFNEKGSYLVISALGQRWHLGPDSTPIRESRFTRRGLRRREAEIRRRLVDHPDVDRYPMFDHAVWHAEQQLRNLHILQQLDQGPTALAADELSGGPPSD